MMNDNTVILTENNAFQNFKKCLRKECTDNNQVQDFLQLCIEFIFYDETRIAGTVSNAIMNDTNEIIGDLKSFGYPDKIITFKDYNKDIISPLAVIVEERLDEWVKEAQPFQFFIVKNIVDQAIERKIEQYLPTLREDERKMINDTTIAVQSGEKAFNIFIDDLLQSSSFAETFYFEIFMKNKNIIEKINKINNPSGKSIITKPRWNVAMTMNIISNIRYFTNRKLASEENHFFLPSFKRGVRDYSRNIKLKHPHISEMINSGIIDKEINRKEFNIEIPSITNYIIEKGHYQPENIIKEVVYLRHHFQPVRDFIRKSVGKETVEKKGVFQNELNNITQNLYNKLRDSSSDKYIIPIENLITYKNINIKIPESEVVNNDLLSICVQAFSEVINNIKNSKYMYDHSKKLMQNCKLKNS